MACPDIYHEQLGATIDQELVLLGSLGDATLVGEGRSTVVCMWDALFQLASVMRMVLGMFNLWVQIQSIVPEVGIENSCPVLSVPKLPTVGSTERQDIAKEPGRKD